MAGCFDNTPHENLENCPNEDTIAGTLDLMGYLIKNSSIQGEIVGDGFLGSGSTLIACEQNWRACRGFELDTRFSDVIVRRWVSYMKENGLAYEVWRNGKLLTNAEIEQFNKKSEE